MSKLEWRNIKPKGYSVHAALFYIMPVTVLSNTYIFTILQLQYVVWVNYNYLFLTDIIMY